MPSLVLFGIFWSSWGSIGQMQCAAWPVMPIAVIADRIKIPKCEKMLGLLVVLEYMVNS